MPDTRDLTPHASWTEITATDADWDAADPGLLTAMYSQLVLIRAFEEYVLELAADGLVHGPAHSSIGQEGAAVGSVLALKAGDTINGSHRGHHQFLAKVLQHVEPKGIDPTADYSPEVHEVLLRTLAEICGLDRGWSHGRGGSMHLKHKQAGAIGTNAIVGGGVPIAAGSAWAHRHAGTDNVAVTYFGDGASNIGSTLESLNLTAAWGVPLCFFVENNHYAVSTSVDEATGEPRLSARGPGFGVRSFRVDGMNALATYLAMEQAVAHMRTGGGPTLVEADVYRYFHQNGPFPGSAFHYRTKEEEASWRARDPIAQLTAHLERRSILTPTQLTDAVTRARDTMRDLGATLLEPVTGGKPGQRRIKPAEWPDPAFANVGVRGDLSEFADATAIDNTITYNNATAALGDVKFIDAVAGVMARRMEQDERIIVIGEDVHRLNGGTNGATRGLKQAFPDRVLGTPISENAFAGLGGGLALDGRFRPVVEFMYADFMWVAADQLFNQIAKARHMFGGEDPVPLVLRSKVAMGTGYGSQHSMDPAGIFATAPGWRIVAPSTPFDYVGLMNSALRCQDPVVVLEHVDLYTSRGPGPAKPEDMDYCLPVGRAAVRRNGNAVTVLTYLAMTNYVLDAVAETGIDAEVVDLRWLDRASLDWDTIAASIRKTHRVLIAEQGALGTSYGGWLADEIQRRHFDDLDAPIERVTGGEASPSISKVLERAAIARTEEVAAKLTSIETSRHNVTRTITPRPSSRPATPTGNLHLRAAIRVDRLLALHSELNESLPADISISDLILKAAALAHTTVPDVNVIWTETGLRHCNSVDLGITIESPNGLITPVITAVERLSIAALAATTRDLARRAAEGELEQAELDGGTCTISDLGKYGTEEFTAVITPPQSSALAIGAVHPEPDADPDGKVDVRNKIRVVFSVDHRAIDGAVAARWLSAFRDAVEAPLRLLA